MWAFLLSAEIMFLLQHSHQDSNLLVLSMHFLYIGTGGNLQE